MNYNFELIEILHLASQALMSDDDTVKRIAIGDIYHAAKSAIRSTSAATEDEIHEAAEVEKQKQREIEHFSFCNGLFPIHTVRTPSGSVGKCVINGRRFSFSSVDASGPDNHACTVRIWDGGNQIAWLSVLRGRSIAESMAMGAFKQYVKHLSGSNKFHGRGGFLKQALKRLQGKERAQ